MSLLCAVLSPARGWPHICHNAGATSDTTQLVASTSTSSTEKEMWVDGIVCLPISKVN